MAKRGYKLQEFMAHSGNVNCLSLAKKRRGLFITGGDDHIVNLWSIGKPTALTSLCGHSSPVESVAFDSKEAFVVAGASAGAIKLWDLDETKMVRTLNGHRSYCTAVEFHPFGEFFASGSKDTNLKIWDIRKKECIHTYKGHTRGISTVRFTPDGRWVVSGGFDNVVKIWDLTAGKLLHDFKLHEGHIRSIDFHPIEFLLATGSADRTVKFWDLETFELIGSSRPESTGIRSITFHPEGRTLFTGLDDSLKVYSWEPVVCHDAVDMGWSTLGDLCIQDGKLLGGSYYQNFVGVWVTDISLIEPYRESSQPEPNSNCEQRQNFQETSLQKVGSFRRSTSTSSLRCISPDDETKEIKNIYVDTEGVNPVTSRKVGSIKYPKIVSSSNAKEINKSPTQRQVPAVGLPVKPIGQAITKSFVVPTVVPRDSSDGKQTFKSRRESITSAKAGIVMSAKPSHIRRPSNTTLDVERLPITVEIKGGLDITRDSNFHSRLVADDDARESSEEKPTNIESVEEKCEKLSLSRIPSNQENCNESLDERKGVKAVKYVNGVAVVRGRTRSLVERFERRENFQSDELQTPDSTPQILPVTVKAPNIVTPDLPPRVIPETLEAPTIVAPDLPPRIMPDTVKAPTIVAPDLPPRVIPDSVKAPAIVAPDLPPRVIPDTVKAPAIVAPDLPPRVIPDTVKAPSIVAPDLPPRVMPDTVKAPTIVAPDLPPRIIPDTAKASTMVEGFSIHHSAPRKISETLKKSPRNSHPRMIRRETMIRSYDTVIEDLMKNHDVFLSTLRSRLTKLQVVRHFLERNDIKGAINAMQKLPDHSVQADLISFLMGKMEILTLDLFLCLLPVLLGLLDSKAERHVNVSLELLLKLVAVFGPVIRSTISAPPAVGVNLQAEQRLECCNQCFILLEKIQKTLPALIRRGGLLAKCALELTLVLQDS